MGDCGGKHCYLSADINALDKKPRSRNRNLFSVGISKRAIIGQYLAEVILIAAVAFGSAYFISNASAEQIGGYLLEQSTQQNMQFQRSCG